MARSYWSGAIIVAGFPFNVKAYGMGGSSPESFKTLCPCHGDPIAQKNTCRTTGDILTDVDKGVENGKDNFVALDAAVIEAIGGTKSATIDPLNLPPVASIPLELSQAAYRLVNADAASAQPVATLWTVLRKTMLAIDAVWTPRGGGKDERIVIHATEAGLMANKLPWHADLREVPAGEVLTTAVPDAQVTMFEKALPSLYSTQPFDMAAHKSEAAGRRTELIAKALAGQPMPAAPAATAPAGPDLMAALQASLAAAGADTTAAHHASADVQAPTPVEV